MAYVRTEYVMQNVQCVDGMSLCIGLCMEYVGNVYGRDEPAEQLKSLSYN